MSPGWSSAGGLKGRTRATRLVSSRCSTPGVDANTSPFFSYVPSPGSNSSATAIWSPGRTIFGSMLVPLTSLTTEGARYLALRGLRAEDNDRHPPDVIRVEPEGPGEGERIGHAVRHVSAPRRDPMDDELLGRGVVEAVHDPGDRQGPVEEGQVRVLRLRPERRVREDRVEASVEFRDVGVPPVGLDLRAPRVPLRDLNRRGVDVDPDDLRGPQELRRDSQDSVPASGIEDPSIEDVPLPEGDVRDLGRDAGRRGVLFDVGSRGRHGLEALEDPFQLDLLHPPTRPDASLLERGRRAFAR